MNRTQIYLPKKHLDALRRVAFKEHTTISDVVRRAVADRVREVQQPGKKKRPETLVEFAKRIAKIGTKGPRDLASNMDTYLYGGE